MPTEERARRRSLVLEAFLAANFGFLALDVYLAHAANAFRHPAEWVPVAFSAGAALVLAAALVVALRAGAGRRAPFARWAGFTVGGLAVLVGLAGTVYHLESDFFQAWTVRSLVYTAPFAAPLTYGGLGLLLVMNRLVDAASAEWSWWLVVFALGGVFAAFGLALCDHAQNGFWERTEWIPVVATALTTGFLAVAVVAPRPAFLRLVLGVLLAHALVGLLGAGLHAASVLGEAEGPLLERILYGAPPFAPLLLVDLSVLAGAGVWELRGDLAAGAAGEAAPAPAGG